MATQMVRISDVSRQIIAEGEQVQVVVTSFPNLEAPVALDAATKEVKALAEADEVYVALELRMPDGMVEPRIVTFEQFSAIFPAGANVATIVVNAQEVKTVKAANTAKRSKEDLDARRVWARENGWPDVKDRGRLPLEAENAYDKAHPTA